MSVGEREEGMMEVKVLGRGWEKRHDRGDG